MGFFASVIYYALPVALFLFVYNFLYKLPELPQYDVDEYWGVGLKKSTPEDTSIRAFEIKFSETKIEELKRKLNETYEFETILEGAEAYEYGMNAIKLRKTIEYWRDDYLPRWKEREVFFNRLPHFKTKIQGLDIHFIHIKPSAHAAKGKVIVPLLLLHGWPGSVREFYDFIPKLLSNGHNLNVMFEIIAPSLPGYGWSDGARKIGFSAPKMAVVLRNLMLRLGHQRFVIQGGDYGSLLGNVISTIFPNNVVGFHNNMCVINSPLSTIKLLIANLIPSWFIEKQYEKMVFPFSTKLKFYLKETGYFHIQATKPDTIGYALANSPVGLAAYIGEKFAGFSGRINEEAQLDNLMVYYLTNSFTTAVRLYAETFGKTTEYYKISSYPTIVPTACARFENDLPSLLDWQLKDKYLNLIQSTYHLNGGHFAAFEVPDVLYADFIEFIKKFNVSENSLWFFKK